MLNCCPKSSQYAAVLDALKAVQDAEKNHPATQGSRRTCAAHKDQVLRLIPIILPQSLVRHLVGNLDHPGLGAKL
jgi:hypothetical protein